MDERRDRNKNDIDEEIKIDLFSEEDEPIGIAENEAVEEMAKEFSFDRYGRRQYSDKDKHKKGKRKRKERYGKRKDAVKAETLVVVKETAAQKDLEEAEKRAKLREEQRNKLLEKELEKKRRTQKQKWKRRLTIIGMAAGLALIVLAAFYFTFRLNSIRVLGTYTRYSQQDIIDRSGLEIGKHMLFQSLDEAETTLETDPYISATVDYIFPNGVQITIVERSEEAAVRWGLNSEYIAIIDEDGMVLNNNSADTHELIEVEGLVLTGAVNGQRIGEAADEQVQALLDMLQKLSEYGLDTRLESMDISETMGIVLYTEEGYRIEVGSTSDLDTKLTRLRDNWTEIMSTAARYVSEGNPNPTIYLYSRSGVTISPYEPGYVVPEETTEPTLSPEATDETATASPTDGTGDTTSPNDTPQPQTTTIPYASAPFAG
ncbi:MAG: FtsQ-type POTRA domain-containing protein [Clostridia bacterium]|nr:FtsQ-type POTRA domain-containing protein [Clostridia bacterium]